ncbi:TPA: hypothetical protein L4Q76_001642 [Pseudomonas aeruginosa]|uniref:hypothetical protein n=1 Tax=Pseudomonas aeruginosa TaxID=287 RepID=UPI001A21C0A8|nr:hypothetical protein [Pseudomonas aeruginosa]EKT9493065.1 hypothetical protein [Pseudomonas aeruginosa]MBH4028432.1 hypothetical protein [Pseudomonas aeruginosa]MBV5530598.1 hypothetical protein [Pseudomonas aeruginosa]MCS8095361.1 hypothetical protein [Pseudomonas aeruginosa]HBO2879626.1 hypothetical protein [Pseudomonas aeruginosa]
MKWLILWLPSFPKQNPDVNLHLVAAGGPIDFARASVDLTLRREDLRRVGRVGQQSEEEPQGATGWRAPPALGGSATGVADLAAVVRSFHEGQH